MQHQIEIVMEHIKLGLGIYPEYFYGILFAVVATLVFLVLFLYKTVTTKQRKLVMDTSERYKALVDLNKSYSFYWNLKENYYEYFRVNSKPKFDRFNFESNMKVKVSSRRDYYLMLLGQIYYNIDEYKKYKKELLMLPAPTTETDANISIRRYQKIEEKLFHKNILNPIRDVTFYADLRYTSPKGRNSYHTQCRFMPYQIEGLLVALKKEQNYKASKAHQRSLMSDSLRYDILKRDGFRCVLCGRTANDGAKLHVDHIKPIAKGGKTVTNNLRTLCDQCNLGKSDKWDAYGVN